MIVLNAPEDLKSFESDVPDIYLHDYFSTNNSDRYKIHLSKNVISMLLSGKKQLYIKNQELEVDQRHIVIIANGNCLMREMVNQNTEYRSLLLFFTNQLIENILLQSGVNPSYYLNNGQKNSAHYVIKKDKEISKRLEDWVGLASNASLTQIMESFQSLISYLIQKEGDDFISFICTLIYSSDDTVFKRVVESNKYSSLGLEELSFLCNMSLSSFKRHFRMKYGESPGKWFLRNRMTKAKEILEKKTLKPSDIYSQFGYENLSNFSAAFKNVFGYSPRKVYSEYDNI